MMSHKQNKKHGVRAARGIYLFIPEFAQTRVATQSVRQESRTIVAYVTPAAVVVVHASVGLQERKRAWAGPGRAGGGAEQAVSKSYKCRREIPP